MIDNTLKQDIQEFLDDHDSSSLGCGMLQYHLQRAEKMLKRVLAEPVDHFPNGTRVRDSLHKGFLGTVTGTLIFYTVRDARGQVKSEYLATSLEVAPELDDQTVWSEVTLLIGRVINQRFGDSLYKDDRKHIRAACYRLLGGAHVKITPEVKARVRDLIEQMAGLLNIEMVGND